MNAVKSQPTMQQQQQQATFCQHLLRKADWEIDILSFEAEKEKLKGQISDLEQSIHLYPNTVWIKNWEEHEVLEKQLEFVEGKLSTWRRAVTKIMKEGEEDQCPCCSSSRQETTSI